MGTNQKILIIEDEVILMDAIAKKLQLEGYEVTKAMDGEEGMEKMRQIKPDLILLDILMPKKNGMEVLEEKSQDKEVAAIPVVIISNSGQPVEIERALSLGVKDYLIKAEFDPSEVLAKVKSVLAVEVKNSAEPEGKKLKDTKRILLIEDDPMLRDLCSRKARLEGFIVETASDAKEGLEKSELLKPDLILMDLVLPGMSGFDVLKKIKTNPDRNVSGIPVIVLSNLGQESDLEKGKELGAADFLTKASTTTTEVVAKIKSVLGV